MEGITFKALEKTAAASAARHQLAADAQRARRILEIDDAEQNLNFVYLLAGAGVDADLLDALDQALTNTPPQRHVVILIDRLDTAGKGKAQPKPKPTPKPKSAPQPPQPRPDGHPY
jgi:hypothetical protein